MMATSSSWAPAVLASRWIVESLTSVARSIRETFSWLIIAAGCYISNPTARHERRLRVRTNPIDPTRERCPAAFVAYTRYAECDLPPGHELPHEASGPLTGGKRVSFMHPGLRTCTGRFTPQRMP